MNQTDRDALIERIGERIADEVEKAAAGRQTNCEQAAIDVIALATLPPPARVKGLVEALERIARLRTELRGDFSMGSHQSDIARSALASYRGGT